MERFMSILIEHFAGDFPVWLAPEQVKIIPVSDNFNDYAKQCMNTLKQHDVRVSVDDRSEQLGGKIRDAETSKIPYMLIVGEKEENDNTVSVRRHKKGDLGTFDFSEFINRITEEIETKRLPDLD
jgi:threonyl-tRNA synthetase